MQLTQTINLKSMFLSVKKAIRSGWWDLLDQLHCEEHKIKLQRFLHSTVENESERKTILQHITHFTFSLIVIFGWMDSTEPTLIN